MFLGIMSSALSARSFGGLYGNLTRYCASTDFFPRCFAINYVGGFLNTLMVFVPRRPSEGGEEACVFFGIGGASSAFQRRLRVCVPRRPFGGDEGARDSGGLWRHRVGANRLVGVTV